MKQVLSTFLCTPSSQLEPEDLKAYFCYYDETWRALRNAHEGVLLGDVTHQDVRFIVDRALKGILEGSPCQRQSLRPDLLNDSRFRDCSVDSLNGIIDLAL